VGVTPRARCRITARMGIIRAGREMNFASLNTTVDTRRWAQTENDAASVTWPDPNPPAPSREEEQRFQQSAPESERIPEAETDE
jgi:hypothetical protein